MRFGITKILLIDDQRTIDQVHKFTKAVYESYRIRVCRNYAYGKNTLLHNRYDILYLDHDLGDFRDGKEYTGMDILKLIQSGDVIKPNKIVLVTSNASVRQSMQLIIDKIYAE